MTLYIRQHDNGWGSGDAYFERITDSWNEDTISWDSQPAVSSTNRYTHAIPTKDHAWRSFDVTSICKDAKDAGDSFGVRIKAVDESTGDWHAFFRTAVTGIYYPGSYPAYLVVEYAEPSELALSGIEIISRYGSKFYLQGEIQNIVADDEICLMYSRPGSADLLNLPGMVLDYTYLHGTAGTFGLQVGGKFIDFSASGYYIFELWRVSGTCGTRTEKVAEYFLKLEAPKYQYQLYFDLDAPEIASNRHLLQGEYDKYNAAKPWTVVPEGEDCFSRIEPSAMYPGGSVGTGWLCQAGEFLSSGCSPLPWWMCPSWTDWDIYMRGECSCSDFRDILQPLGIPCMHLIAAKEYYGDNPPYCPYKVCG